MEKIDERVVRNLNYLVKTYNGLNKLIVSTKNRLGVLIPEAKAAHQDEIIFMESYKGKIVRRISKDLEFFPIWTEWMKGISGIGPWIAGELIILYYFRFVPICKKCGADLVKKEKGNGDGNKFVCSECGKAAKDDGVLATRIEMRDYPKISHWWSNLGQAPDNETGKIPRMKRGQGLGNSEGHKWSPRGRAVCFQIGEQFVRHGDLYREFLDGEKKSMEKNRPDLKKGHRHKIAKMKAVKLFLAHFWQVARTLDGLPLTRPYAETILGHTGILEPFYWEPLID